MVLSEAEQEAKRRQAAQQRITNLPSGAENVALFNIMGIQDDNLRNYFGNLQQGIQNEALRVRSGQTSDITEYNRLLTQLQGGLAALPGEKRPTLERLLISDIYDVNAQGFSSGGYKPFDINQLIQGAAPGQLPQGQVQAGVSQEYNETPQQAQARAPQPQIQQEQPLPQQQPASPEQVLTNIRTVFGPEWQPAPIFQQRGLTNQGIFGAVRIQGRPEVFTLGPGGTRETPESFSQKFGTLEQQGIVGEVTSEQAQKLGIQVPTGPFQPQSAGEGLDTTQPSSVQPGAPGDVTEGLGGEDEEKKRQEDRVSSLFDAYGISSPSLTMGENGEKSITNPFDFVKDAYTKMYESMGVSTVKEEIDKANKELKDLDDDFIDVRAEINDNPWLTEDRRRGKISKEQEKYEEKRNAAVNRLQLNQGFLDDARAEAQFMISTGLNMYYKERDFQFEQMSAALDRADKELDAQRKMGLELAGLGFKERELGLKEKEFGLKEIEGLKPDLTTNIKDYEYALGQGYKGSYLDYLREIETIRAPKTTVIGGGLAGGFIQDQLNTYVQALASGQIQPEGIPNDLGDIKGFKGLVLNQAQQKGVVILSDTQRDKLKDLESANAVIAKIESNLNAILPEMATNLGERVSKGGKLVYGALSQTNTNAALYNDFIQGTVAPLIRSLGEKGTLAKEDVARALQLLPKLTDTQEVAKGDIQQLKDLLAGVRQRTIGTYTEPISVGAQPLASTGNPILSPAGIPITPFNPAGIKGM